MRPSFRKRNAHDIEPKGLKRTRSGKDDLESDLRRGALTVITDSSQEEELTSEDSSCDHIYKQIESLREMYQSKLSEQKQRVLGNLAVQYEDMKERISSEIEDATLQCESLQKVHESITQKSDDNCRKLLQDAYQEIRDVEQIHKNFESSTKQSSDHDKKKILDKFSSDLNRLVDSLGKKKA